MPETIIIAGGFEILLAMRLIIFVPFILSLAVHEWAHAWSARWLGDDTAEKLGRMTVNPIYHIDPVGTLLLPLIGVPFGWAKPVPVEPIRFRRGVSMRAGIVITAIAGPISNVVLAAFCVVGLSVIQDSGAGGGLRRLLSIGLMLNIVLAVFNMLPIPPLDGSRIVDGLVPDRLRPAWERLCRLAPLALVLVIAVPFAAGFSIIEIVVTPILDDLAPITGPMTFF